MKRITSLLLVSLLATSASESSAQSFSVTQDRGSVFSLPKPANKLSWVYIPPATKMFVDLSGDTVLFPPLFPRTAYFHNVQQIPDLLFEPFKGSFTAYEISGHYLALREGYTLYSATIRNGRLFVLAKDRDGDFVALNRDHFSIFLDDGTPVSAAVISNEKRNVAVLVDRSGSIEGFDQDIEAALNEIASTPIRSDYCSLYEFGDVIRLLQSPMQEECGDVFASYQPSMAAGTTPLFEVLERAYRDAAASNGISVTIVVSDGAPTDAASHALKSLSETTPTFVLWVGNHTSDYLESYSTAHAISQDGTRAEITDFLRGVSFSISGHQMFELAVQ